MKKGIIFICLVLCLSLCGCSSKENSEKQTEKTTATTSAQQEIALDLKYVAYGNGRDMHKGKEITDADIINKIEDFITEVQKYPVEAESREKSTDLPKGGYIEIKINNGDKLYKRIYIVSADIERVHFSDKTDSEKSGYYYTDNNITHDFHNEMIDYARSQGWVG